jgi:exodeoxyribonuclease V alpha subunit
LKWTYDTEKYITETVLSTLKSEQILWEFDVEQYREIDGMKLTDEQMNAIKNVCKYNISILNGSAGSGKSFSTQAIIRMLEDNNISYKLFAPTGKQNCPII